MHAAVFHQNHIHNMLFFLKREKNKNCIIIIIRNCNLPLVYCIDVILLLNHCSLSEINLHNDQAAYRLLL
jgi:hypothetical protein